MLQPFEPFRAVYISKLLELQKIWVVTQSYPRGITGDNEATKQPLLLSDYDDPGLAKIHLNAVKHDIHAGILNLHNAAHRQQLLDMLVPTSQFEIFWAIVKSKQALQQQVQLHYKLAMKKYVERHTSWRIGGDKTIYPVVEVTFGEVFIVLKYAGQTLRLKFEEIEK